MMMFVVRLNGWMEEYDKMHLFDDYPDLLPGEIVALNYYTTNNGYQINYWLRKQAEHNVEPTIESAWNDAHGVIFQKHLDNAFNKLPRYSSESLLRIEGKNLIDYNSITTGTVLPYPNFISTAKDSRSTFIIGIQIPDDQLGVIFEIVNDGTFNALDISPFHNSDLGVY